MDASPEVHRQLAATLFNRTWDLLDAGSADADELLLAAFASKYHWTKSPGVTAENLAIADNQIARCASAAGLGDLAVHYAHRCLDRTIAEGWNDWRLASAFEVSARAAAAAGDTGERDAFVARARSVLATVIDDEDRAAIEGQLATIP